MPETVYAPVYIRHVTQGKHVNIEGNGRRGLRANMASGGNNQPFQISLRPFEQHDRVRGFGSGSRVPFEVPTQEADS